MINKKFYNHHDKPSDFLNRVHEFCYPITATLGPGGMNSIIFTNDSEVPHVTKDGVTISESIHFADNITNCIAALIKESARKTAKIAGDGTTTSIVLTEALLQSITVLPDIQNKRKLFEAIKDYVYRVVEYLEDSKLYVKSSDKSISKIVNISSNGDKEIVSLVLKAFEAVPDMGIVNVITDNVLTSSIEVIDGMYLDTRYYCVPAGTYKNPAVCVVEGPVNKAHKLQSFLRIAKYIKDNDPTSITILIAKEFSDEVKQTVLVNNNRGITNIALVIAEGFGTNRLDVLKDIASRGNGTLLSTDGTTEFGLEDCTEDHLCYNITKAIFKPLEITLILSNPELLPDQEKTLNKLNQAYLTSLTNEDTAETSQLKRRLSKYSKVANIIVGGNTEAEKMERKDRFDDAVCAARSAIKDGVLIGGGISLLEAIKSLAPTEEISEEDTIAYEILETALATPFNTLVKNAGIENECDFSSLKKGEAYDISTGKIVDALSEGILDPANVTIQALINASSVALNILRSRVFIVEDEG